jgi:hypothetical protein
LATEADFATGVNVDDHGGQFVTQLGNVFDLIHAVVGQLADMHHTVDTG